MSVPVESARSGPGPSVALISHLPYYRHAAEALHRSGLLESFIASPVSGTPLSGTHLPVIGSPIRYYNTTRVDPGLEGVPIRRLWGAQVLALGLQRAALASGRGTGLAARARVWDLAATIHLGSPNVVHAVAELAGWCTNRGRRHGALTVIDVRAAHPRAQIASVAPLLARRGIDYRIPEAGLIARLERSFAAADVIVCNSEYTRSTFLEQGLSEDRVVTVPLGCDVERFRPDPVPSERFTVLFIGRERHAKGVLDLADAVRSLGPRSRLWLSGDPDPVTVQALAGTSAEIAFLGSLAIDEMAEVYRQASILALPSYSDGFGMVVLEAMASGLPVVVSDRVGAAAAVSAGGAGFVVPAGDADALAERLVALERDPDLVWRLGTAARTVAEEHPWSAYGERLVRCYREVIKPLIS